MNLSKWKLVLFCCFLTTSFFAQEMQVSGTVIDENGEALIGVNIIIKNSIGLGTTTEIDGSYEITVPAADAILIFSYIGFSPKEIPVNGQKIIDVTFDQETELLNEIVVVGYGVQRKSDLTGSVSTVKGAEITKIPTSSVDQALQGKIAGVQVLSLIHI